MLETMRKVIYKVAIYIRLSKEDEDKGYDESESIKNQKALLTEYVNKLGPDYELIDLYIDPGFTGTNFNRPDFQRMIGDIEDGKVNMVITKDLSRLGRDYIETGEYIEKWFPENNVRYVSITDGIDTFSKNNGNNDIAPFKSILNDMYSKDLSRKIRTALHTMQKNGKWVGGREPLGYMKDPKDKNHLVICEDEAHIVRKIFNMALAGKQLSEIRDYLNDNNIPTYSQIRRNKVTAWETKTIKQILKNELYVGNMIQNRRSRISYKNRKIRANPREEWIIIEGTHEPLVSETDFRTIQKKKIAQFYERNKKEYHYLLDGLLVCYECKHKIGVKKDRNDRFYMVCNNYRRNSKLNLCTSHGFPYKKLEENILEYIRKLFSDIDEKKIESNIKNSKTKCDYEKTLKKIEQEVELINNNIDKMYVDKLSGKISEEMYNRLFKKLNNEIKEKEKQYIEIKESAEKYQDDDRAIDKIIKEFLNMENPTPELMRVIINRIEIHQDKQVDLIFNFNKLNYFFNKESLL